MRPGFVHYIDSYYVIITYSEPRSRDKAKLQSDVMRSRDIGTVQSFNSDSTVIIIYLLVHSRFFFSLPWRCACVARIRWRSLCHRWRTGTAGSWRVPVGRHGCAGAAGGSTAG